MKKSYYVIFLIILMLYFGIIFVFFREDFTKKEKKKEEYIYFSYNNFWKYNGLEFINVSTNKIGEKKFYTYENGIYKGKYNLGIYENELYLFNDQNNKIDYQEEILAFSNSKHQVYPLKTAQILDTDYAIIQRYFQSIDLDSTSLNPEYIQKYLLDLNHDEKLEEIYRIDNIFEENKKEKGYSLIFIHDNGKIYEIIKEIKTNEKSFSDGYSYGINNIADLDNDNKTDFIISKAKYGASKICYLVVQKIKKEYKITKEC